MFQILVIFTRILPLSLFFLEKKKLALSLGIIFGLLTIITIITTVHLMRVKRRKKSTRNQQPKKMSEGES